MQLPVLRELILIAGVSLVMVLLLHRFRIPALVAFIAAGAVLGPGMTGLIRDETLVHSLAELGVVLLLFMVGLELSLADLRRLGRRALIGGAAYVVAVLALVAGPLAALGVHPATAIFAGMLAAVSSTAVVFKLLTDRGDLDTPYGRLATGVLIFQDLACIPFVLLVPVLGRWHAGAGNDSDALATLVRMLAQMLLLAIAFAGLSRAMPWVLGRASRVRSHETFLFGVVLVALGGAWLASWAGASLALGAFLAGLLLAGSDLRSQIAADVLPFRDALASVFFVAMGMSLQPAVLWQQPALVLASTVGLVLLKVVAGWLALRLAGERGRIASASALTLAQVGEFSFVLVSVGAPAGLLDEAQRQAFTAGAVFSLALTPLLIARADAWTAHLPPEPRDLAAAGSLPEDSPRRDHVVIAGYGLNGSNLARVLRAVKLPHVIIDLSPEVLAQARADGSPAMLGDVANPAILRDAGVPDARIVVFALSDRQATLRACRLARSLSPRAFLLVRTRYVAEIDALHDAGASQVIPEEFETSIEIFTSVLREFHLPTNLVQAQVRLLRQERYSLLRGRKLPRAVVESLELLLAEGVTETFLLLQHSAAVGLSLGELGLASAETNAARVVAVVRGGEVLPAPGPDVVLRVGDTVVVTGPHAAIEQVHRVLRPLGDAV